MSKNSPCTMSPIGSDELDYDDLAERLRALSHAVRLKVLVRLARRERCPCGEIVRDLPKAQSTVSQHLKVLVEAGLLKCAPEGQRTHYQIDRDAILTLRAEMDALFAELEPTDGQSE